MKYIRKSNIELLRIILILMIIILHYNNANIGGLLGEVNDKSHNYWIAHVVESFCIVAVNTFIIITGYFSFEKKTIKVSKVINLFQRMIFYGLIIPLIILILGKIEISNEIIKNIIKNSINRWFIVIYAILYLLIPYINIVIRKINKNQYKILLLIIIIFFYRLAYFFDEYTFGRWRIWNS